jgi:hypothetical protein
VDGPALAQLRHGDGSLSLFERGCARNPSFDGGVMTNPKISMAEFEFLVRRAGLKFLSEQQQQDCYSAFTYVESMTERLRQERPREAEPAHVFTFEEKA